MTNKSSFDRFFDQFGDKLDASLRLHFLHKMMTQDQYFQQEREKLIEDVAERVLSRINVTVDATDIINRIDELEKALNSLFKYFK